jgi:hypothetical protein
MTIVIGLLLMLLGLAIGIVLAWAFNVGISTSLFVGVLLVVVGAIIGFISEWLIIVSRRCCWSTLQHAYPPCWKLG